MGFTTTLKAPGAIVNAQGQKVRTTQTLQVDRSPSSYKQKLAEVKAQAIAKSTRGVPANVARAQAAATAPPPPSGANPNFVAPPSQVAYEALPPASTATEDINLVQTTTSEGQATPAEATTDPLNPQYAALARKERAQRNTQRQLLEREQALKAREAAMISRDTLKADPLKVLSELGITYDRLTELQLGQGQESPVDPRDHKLAELEARLAKYEQNSVSRDNEAYKQAISIIRDDATLLVDSDSAFEVTKATGQTEEVVKLIETLFQRTGKVLSVEEAAREVEKEVRVREIARVRRINALASIQSELNPTPLTEGVPEATSPLKPQAPKTLTNQGSAQRPLTARERAILAFEGRLSK